jgi:hypothetical protein
MILEGELKQDLNLLADCLAMAWVYVDIMKLMIELALLAEADEPEALRPFDEAMKQQTISASKADCYHS